MQNGEMLLNVIRRLQKVQNLITCGQITLLHQG